MGVSLLYGPPDRQEAFHSKTAAARASGIEYELEKVTDVNRIVQFGALTTPALAVDGVVKVAGKVPTISEIQRLLA